MVVQPATFHCDRHPFDDETGAQCSNETPHEPSAANCRYVSGVHTKKSEPTGGER